MPATGGTLGFAFTGVGSDGAQVTWSGCSSIPVVVNPVGAPAGALADLAAAVKAISSASDVPLVLAGTTTEPASREVAGRRVIIAWDTTADGLLGDDIAATTTTWHTAAAIVAARVVINQDLDAHRPGGLGPGTRQGVYLHELGHVVGLAHVASRTSVMNPDAAFEGQLSASDRIALQRIRVAIGCGVAG